VGKRLLVEVGSLSDPGQVRELNEDYLGTPQTMEISLDVVERRGRLYAVADGMGGHAAGEVASRQAISILFKEYYTSPSAEIIKTMKQAIEAANAEVHAQASLDRARAGMGTTLVAAVLQGDDLYVANVGDSRAYLVREQGIEQVTKDHSWVNEQVQAGIITEQEAREHLYRNIITRSLGTKPSVDIDFFQRKVQQGDVLVLCCDGLSNEVENDEIARVVSATDPQEAAHELIDLANQRGGPDNITAIVVRIGEVVKRPLPVLPLAVGGGLAVILIAAAVYFGRGPIGTLLATPTATPTTTWTPTLVPTYTPTPTGTPTSTATATPTDTPAPTDTSTPEPTGTPTSTPTVAPTPTYTNTPRPTPTPTVDQTRVSQLLCDSNIYDGRNPLPGRTVRFRTPIDINPNGIEEVLDAIKNYETKTGGMVTFNIVNSDPSVGITCIEGDGVNADGSPGCGNVSGEIDPYSGHNFVTGSDGAFNSPVYVHLGSSGCDHSQVGYKSYSVAEHELAHALGIGDHFKGFTGNEGLSRELIAVVTMLYSMPSGTDMSACSGLVKHTETAPPLVVSTYPPDGATGVGRDLMAVSITFNEPMQSRWSLSCQGFPRQAEDPVDYDSATYTFTFRRTSSQLLPPNATITYVINPEDHKPGFLDVAGNPASMTTFTFTVGD